MCILTLGKKSTWWFHDYYKWAKERSVIHCPEYTE